MLLLRAYLWVVRSEADIVVSTHRDLEGLRSAWQEAGPQGIATGIVHVGFTRPNTAEVLPLALEYPGRVILTAAARFSLIGLTEVAPAAAGSVDGLPMYVAISGWGYICNAEDLGLSEDKNSRPRSTLDWVASVSVTNTALAQSAAASGIQDEETYQAYEYRLPAEDRKALGLFRLRALGCPDDAADPQLIVRCAPPWLLRRATSSLDVTTRISNVFTNEGIVAVADLANYSQQQFLDLQNFGRRSLRALADVLLAALDEGPPQEDLAAGTADLPPLLTVLRTTLVEMPQRTAYILRRRMGLDVSPATLQEIGDEFGLTRERIRQIEAKHIADTSRAFEWSKYFLGKITSLLSGRTEPLPLGALGEEDAWFAGISAYPHVLSFLTESFGAGRFHLLDIGGRLFLTELSDDGWNAAVKDGQRILESAVGHEWVESQARQSVQALLATVGAELRHELWQFVSRKAHFASVDGAEPILTGYGRAVENMVEVILTECPEPLHYSEIADRAAARLGRSVDMRRAHNAAAEVGYLYGRGTYGLLRHFPLSQDEAETIAAEAESIVASGQPGRQWHCAELVEALAAQGLDFEERLNPYLVNIALLQWGQELSYLGRLVWVAADGKELNSAHRIDVHQALISILRDAGEPLKTRELKSRLIKARGLGTTFQIHAEAPLCRVSKGSWGLLDRDVGISADQRGLAVAEIEGALQKKNTGLHISELAEAVPTVGRLVGAGVELSTILSIATLGSRIRMSSERYLYLEAWGGPRRHSLHDALCIVLDRAPAEGLSFDEVAGNAAACLGREISRPAISSKLQAIGARWDERGRRWRSPIINDAIEIQDEASLSNEPAL